jgi:hypothetical protein
MTQQQRLPGWRYECNWVEQRFAGGRSRASVQSDSQVLISRVTGHVDLIGCHMSGKCVNQDFGRVALT